MDDLRYGGDLYSWCNKQLDNPIMKKLDRVLVNQEWILKFPNSGANFLSPILSDHSVCMVFGDFSSSRCKSSFKFFDFWTDFDEFFSVVAQVWQSNVSGSLFQVVSKLKLL